MKTDTHNFRKGQVTSLDQIYAIQALAGGDWWEPSLDADSNGIAAKGAAATHASGETILITRTLSITITWK